MHSDHNKRDALPNQIRGVACHARVRPFTQRALHLWLHIVFCGRRLPVVREVIHLGHILTYNLKDDNDVLSKCKDMVRKANALLVSPASLLDSQHGCITSPHAKKESGQTPYAVWSPLVQEFLGQGSGFDCCGVWFLFIFADSATTFADSARPNYQQSLTRLLLRVR